MQISRVALSATVAAASIATTAAADVVLSDTEFAISNWGFETAVQGAAGTSTPSQVGGGNPGNARQVVNSVNANGTIFGFSRYGTSTSTRFEPATQGAINSVDWSIDSRWLSGIGGQGQSISFGAKQGSVVYVADYDITGSSGGWNTHSALTLTAADFQPLTAGPAIDFSAAGAPLRFGFVVGNSATDTAYTNTVMYDNFNVIIHNVPSPGCASLLTLGAAAAFRRRRAAGR